MEENKGRFTKVLLEVNNLKGVSKKTGKEYDFWTYNAINFDKTIYKFVITKKVNSDMAEKLKKKGIYVVGCWLSKPQMEKESSTRVFFFVNEIDEIIPFVPNEKGEIPRWDFTTHEIKYGVSTVSRGIMPEEDLPF